MAVISNEELRRIAFRIMDEPGFSTDGQGLLRAHQRWTELTTPAERLAAERALFARWLEDLRAERSRPPVPAPRDRRPKVVAVTPERTEAKTAWPLAVPGAEVKFRSESPDWRDHDDSPATKLRTAPIVAPSPGEQDSAPAIGAAIPNERSPARKQDSPRSGPVAVTSATPVQQPSRKVAAYRQMFPELAFHVQAESGAKPLAEFSGQDIDYRIAQLREQRQDWRTANAGDESRIGERERLNARDRVRVAERAQHIRDAQAEEERLEAAKFEMAGTGVAVIGDLPADALAACGFKRRVA